jgi:mannose-6-phosphate isomerase-like protein (cupin superfamily)
MTTAFVDSPKSEQAKAWWFLDTLVIEHRCAPGMETVVLEMTLPVGAAPPLHVHDDLDDTWYILDGEMVVRCGVDESPEPVTGSSCPAACHTRSGWSVTEKHGYC